MRFGHSIRNAGENRAREKEREKRYRERRGGNERERLVVARQDRRMAAEASGTLRDARREREIEKEE